MSQILIVQFVFSLLAAFLGGVAGWWLRGRPLRQATQTTVNERKHVAEQALHSLHAAAETVRTCVEQHIECMRAVQLELQEGSASEPAIINNAAASIIAANGLVQHQMDDLHRQLASQRDEISDCLTSTEKLLFTFASLDRQKHVYRQVLSSLETLAAELLKDVDGHGRRLKQITKGIETQDEPNLDSVNGAVTQILDATEDIQRRVETTEKRIEQQAESVQMQAILSHADLLTSLPNRRALEAELERAVARAKGRPPLCSVIFVDLDKFSQINTEYGHHGGDVILRQAAGIIKELARGKDTIARFGGDTFALLLNDTTLHDALPIAERIRKALHDKEFSHGSRPLHITGSVGIAQLYPEEMVPADFSRAEEAMEHAKNAGGNICYRHDGQACFPVSSVFHTKDSGPGEESLSLASLWRDSSAASVTGGVTAPEAAATKPANGEPTLSGRSLFAANMSRRLAEWKRGGMGVSVAVVQVDQLDDLVKQFGPQGHNFLRQVMGRLLEAATRDMDERCEFEDGLFALILPATDETNAVAVAERLRSQVRQCKVRMGNELWDLTASIGLAHCTVAARVMDIMLCAEAAMQRAAGTGGDAIQIGAPVKVEEASVAGH